FLPQLPKQVLLANLLADFPEMTIVTDAVDAEMVARPGKWDMNLIRRFMIVFGAISSVFDYLTFAVLIFIFHCNAQQFRTAWFTESLVSACLIVLVVRTRKPFFRSRPSLPMILANLAAISVTLALPYTPLGPLLELSPLPASVILAVVLISLIYVLAAEVGKQFFYRTYR
ncbi:MAG: cation transporting ATPase C-terminal domain-containing protein, partial [Cyanobacteria bacterium REEB67]|nr:cation transporting ATPase C-terminal domain-containing protein [Cyanobacteria bacterium REEB67]